MRWTSALAAHKSSSAMKSATASRSAIAGFVQTISTICRGASRPDLGLASVFRNGDLATSDAFEDGHALLLELVTLDVNQVGAWQAVLGDQDRLLVAFNVCEKIRGLALQCRDGFGTHEVTLRCLFREVNKLTGQDHLRSAGD